MTPPNKASSDASQRGGFRTPPRTVGGANGGLSSPPQDTQPFSQFVYSPNNRFYAVDDEEAEGVWGYLVPLDAQSGDVLVLRRRSACPVSSDKLGNTSGSEKVPAKQFKKQEEDYEQEKTDHGVTSGGYLIGRHPECGKCTSTLILRTCL